MDKPEPGCIDSNNQFYAALEIGYWYQNQFYGTECGYDLSSNPNAYPMARMDEWTNWQYVQGCKVKYRYRGQFFNTLREAQCQAPPRAPAALTVFCALCKEKTNSYIVIFKKSCCLKCLYNKVVANDFKLTINDEEREWSLEIVYEVYQALSQLPESQRPLLPPQCPYPSSYYICCGKDAPTVSGYPPYGHFVGVDNYVREDSCPVHPHCKTCAQATITCRYCEYFIRYEEPLPTTPDCDNHCPSFAIPCKNCGKVNDHTKKPPA